MCALRNVLLVGLLGCVGLTAMGKMAKVNPLQTYRHSLVEKALSASSGPFLDSQASVERALTTTGVEFKFITADIPLIGSIVDGVNNASIARPTAEVVAKADQLGLKIVPLVNTEERRYWLFFTERTEEIRHLVFKKGHTPEEQIEEALAAMGKELYGDGAGITYIENTYPFSFKQPDWDSRHVWTAIANYVETSENYEILIPTEYNYIRGNIPIPIMSDDVPVEELGVVVKGTFGKKWR